MQRALQLAEYGRGTVSPNPMVGCVIVHNGKIIGEGWHRAYGGPHAEVWAVSDAEARGNEALLPNATVYVTLEPCSHTGKTPPCADLLVRKEVKRVVICNGDPNPLVAGRGITRLRGANIIVDEDILAPEGLELNKRFFESIATRRPYIILKWAETADGFLSGENGEPVRISGELSNIHVHQWRSQEDAILVGYNTAMKDNPRLNVRHLGGNNPVRIVLDRQLKLPANLHLFDNSQATIVFNQLKATPFPNTPERYAQENKIAYMQADDAVPEIESLLFQLHARGIQSVLVEGGAATLQAFLSGGYWNEIRRCQSPLVLGQGITAPVFSGNLVESKKTGDDLWTFYVNGTNL